jgi:hypothetical protein
MPPRRVDARRTEDAAASLTGAARERSLKRRPVRRRPADAVQPPEPRDGEGLETIGSNKKPPQGGRRRTKAFSLWFV